MEILEPKIEYTQEELDQYSKEIEELSHKEMAKLWRYAPAGHPFFNQKLPLYEQFQKKFFGLGGMTSEISKEIERENDSDNSVHA